LLAHRGSKTLGTCFPKVLYHFFFWKKKILFLWKKKIFFFWKKKIFFFWKKKIFSSERRIFLFPGIRSSSSGGRRSSSLCPSVIL